MHVNVRTMRLFLIAQMSYSKSRIYELGSTNAIHTSLLEERCACNKQKLKIPFPLKTHQRSMVTNTIIFNCRPTTIILQWWIPHSTI